MQAAVEERTPLERLSRALPEWAAPALSFGGRLVGAAIALYLAGDASYDRTQVVSSLIAVIALASLISLLLPGTASDAVSGLAAGVLFFGGAMLWSEGAAKAMPVAGFAVLAGTVMGASVAGRTPLATLAAFFAGLAVIVGMLVVVALAVEG